MMGNDLLVGKKIRLAMLTREDVPILTEWFSRDIEMLRLGDDNVMYPFTLADEEAWFESLQERESSYTFAVRTLEDNQLVGNCGMGNFHHQAHAAEVGINIGTGFRSQGYGTDAMQVLLRFGFMELNLNRICLHVFAINTRAIRSYEKTGFVLEGKYRNAMLRDGQVADLAVMSILRCEWVPLYQP
jgi:RimJ/RimL family protein N-acetyltransferase